MGRWVQGYGFRDLRVFLEEFEVQGFAFRELGIFAVWVWVQEFVLWVYGFRSFSCQIWG